MLFLLQAIKEFDNHLSFSSQFCKDVDLLLHLTMSSSLPFKSQTPLSSNIFNWYSFSI